MDKVIESAKALREEIDNLPEMKEYMLLMKLYEDNDELKEMRQNIAKLEQEGKLEEKKNLIAIYESHPIVNNFNLAKEEIKSILETIKDILSD